MGNSDLRPAGNSIGGFALSDADEKETLHEAAYNKTPERVWLVYVGFQLRLLSLSRQSDSWSESDKFYEAIDAMGYNATNRFPLKKVTWINPSLNGRSKS